MKISYIKGVFSLYKIEVNESKKAFIVIVDGFIQEEEGMQFLTDYKSNVSKVNPKEYSMIIGGENLVVSKQEMLPVLGQAISMYMDTGFKRYFGTYPKSAIAKVQLSKIVKEKNFDVTFKDSVNEILEIL